MTSFNCVKYIKKTSRYHKIIYITIAPIIILLYRNIVMYIVTGLHKHCPPTYSGTAGEWSHYTVSQPTLRVTLVTIVSVCVLEIGPR